MEKEWAGWIPTKERMPSVGTEVVMVASFAFEIDEQGRATERTMHVGHWTQSGEHSVKWWVWGKDYGLYRCVTGQVTHWMPLPEIPIESASVDAPA